MTITNGYCTLNDLKQRLGIDYDSVEDDARLESIIEATSRWIDDDRNRVFYPTTATRYFTPMFGNHIRVDDIISITSVSVAVGTSRSYTEWASTDYDLEPYNETPKMSIWVAPSSSRYFVPKLRKSVQITASWGYSATTPDVVEQVCLMLAHYIWMRKDSPLGVAGGAGILGEFRDNPAMRHDDALGLLQVIPKRFK